MGLAIRVIITGDAEQIEKLGKLGQSLTTSREAMKEIGQEFAAYFAGQVFESRGGVLGEKWDDLDAIYKVLKAKKYPGRSPLQRTGAMRAGFDYEADDGSVTVFNKVDYFSYHQSDEPRTSNLPRRVMLKANDDVRKIAAEIIDADINDKIRKAGF